MNTRRLWLGFCLTLELLAGCRAAPPPTPSVPTPFTPAEIADPPATYTARLSFTANGDLYVIHANGAGRQNLTATAAVEGMPAWAPDGATVAFTADDAGSYDIFSAPNSAPGDLAARRNLTQNAAWDHSPAWSPDGTRLAFASNRQSSWGIYVISLFPGEPEFAPLVPHVARLSYNGFFEGHPAWSPDGTRIAYTSDRGFRWQIYVVGVESGVPEPFPGTGPLQSTAYPAWSPDGTRLAFASTLHRNWDIFTCDINGEDLRRLTFDAGQDWGPAWSPDGEWIAFVSDRSSAGDIYLINVETGTEHRLTSDAAPELYPAWLP